MKKRQAQALDSILNEILKTGQRIITKPEFHSYCKHLKDEGYLEILSYEPEGYDIDITDAGSAFIRSGGFTQKLEDETFNRLIKRRTFWAAAFANLIALASLAVSIATYYRDSSKKDHPTHKQTPQIDESKTHKPATK